MFYASLEQFCTLLITVLHITLVLHNQPLYTRDVTVGVQPLRVFTRVGSLGSAEPKPYERGEPPLRLSKLTRPNSVHGSTEPTHGQYRCGTWRGPVQGPPTREVYMVGWAHGTHQVPPLGVQAPPPWKSS